MICIAMFGKKEVTWYRYVGEEGGGYMVSTSNYVAKTMTRKKGCQESRPPSEGHAASKRSPETHQVRPQHTEEKFATPSAAIWSCTAQTEVQHSAVSPDCGVARLMLWQSGVATLPVVAEVCICTVMITVMPSDSHQSSYIKHSASCADASWICPLCVTMCMQSAHFMPCELQQRRAYCVTCRSQATVAIMQCILHGWVNQECQP